MLRHQPKQRFVWYQNSAPTLIRTSAQLQPDAELAKQRREEHRWQTAIRRHGQSSANVLTGTNRPVRSVGVSITGDGPMVDVAAPLKSLPKSRRGAGRTS